MRVVVSILIPSLGLCLAACMGAAPSTGSTTQAIINGEDSPSSEDSVVLLVHADRQSVAACSATFVAPNLLLTALHCVSETDESSACDEKGKPLAGGDVGKPHTASDLYVFIGNTRPDFNRGAPPTAAKGKKIFIPDTDTICAHDIALVLLDRNVEGAKISPLRLDTEVVEAETITSIGWGVTTKTDSPETRQRRADVPITGVGPMRSGNGRSLGPSEFEVGESICSGDSGGPAISTDTGSILGVVSRGGNGRQSQADPSVQCTGGNAFNIYTGVAGHKDMILAAFAEAEATPWLEGELNPILSTFGTVCTAGEECQQGSCVKTSGADATCNLDCSTSECPEGFVCSDVDDAKACTAIPKKKTTTTETSCAASPGSSSGTGYAFCGLAALVFAAAATRRSARRR